jgi:hypothetical protein
MNTCSIPECGKLVYVRGWCEMHYYRWKRTGSTDDRPRTVPTCSIPECGKQVWGRGWCRGHYMRWRRTGDPLPLPPKPLTIEERFWSYVEKTDTCWLWTGMMDGHGSGLFQGPDRRIGAHAYAYELLVGPIPPKHILANVCTQSACVRPDPEHHVLARRGQRFDPVHGLVWPGTLPDSCRRGHPRTPETTITRASGKRICRICQREEGRRRSSRRLAR